MISLVPVVDTVIFNVWKVVNGGKQGHCSDIFSRKE